MGSIRLRSAVAVGVIATSAVACSDGGPANTDTTTPTSPEPTEWIAVQHVNAAGRVNLDVVALDATQGEVPNRIRTTLLPPPDRGGSQLKPSDDRDAPRSTKIGDVIIDVTIDSETSITITGRGRDRFVVSNVVKALGDELVEYENNKDDLKYNIRLAELVDAIAVLEAERDAIEQEWRLEADPATKQAIGRRLNAKRVEVLEETNRHQRLLSEYTRKNPTFTAEYAEPVVEPA